MNKQILSPIIYLDHQATTPLDPRVWDSMKRWIFSDFANPHSVSHAPGRLSAEEVDAAREKLADCLGAFPEDVIFTSGATEANNLAILGFAFANSQENLQFITAVTEHKSVLEPMRSLRGKGFDVEILQVDKFGRIDLHNLSALLKKKPSFVSISAANSEIGVLNPVNEIGRLCNDNEAIFHCDATQAIGKIDLDLTAANINLLSLSGHKIYGPKGIGALIVQSHLRNMLRPLILGGGQQHGLRSGTIPTFLAVGLAEAVQISASEKIKEVNHLKKMSSLILQELTGNVEFSVNGDIEHRLPNNLNLKFDRPAIEIFAQLPNLAMSTGSACLSSGSFNEPSYVLKAIGLSDEEIRQSVRLSVGRFTTVDEIKNAAAQLISVLGCKKH